MVKIGRGPWCRIHTGVYTGDGEAIPPGQVITIPFKPKFVKIWLQNEATLTQEISEVVDTRTPPYSDLHGVVATAEHGTQGNRLAITSNNFRVGDRNADSHPNKLGQIYAFMVLG